jgi:hypothetical protein
MMAAMPVAKVKSKRYLAELRDNYRPVGAHGCDEALGRKTHSLGRMRRAASSQLGIGCRVRLFSGGWRGNGKEGSGADERVPLQTGCPESRWRHGPTRQGGDRPGTRSRLRIVSQTVLESRTCAGGHGWPA